MVLEYISRRILEALLKVFGMYFRGMVSEVCGQWITENGDRECQRKDCRTLVSREKPFTVVHPESKYFILNYSSTQGSPVTHCYLFTDLPESVKKYRESKPWNRNYCEECRSNKHLDYNEYKDNENVVLKMAFR